MTEAVYERTALPAAATAPIAAQLEHLPVLDSVRGVAILAVVLFHATLFTLDQGKALGVIDRLYLGVASLGWCGVDLFFVLSGFLITRILLHSKQRPKYFRNFYARRTLRIFPLYYAAVLTYLAIAAIFHLKYAASAAPWLLTYTSNLVFTFDKSFIVPLTVGHFWSLAIEEQFYLFWPFLVLVLSRAGLGRASILFFVLAFVARSTLVHVGNTFAAYRFTIGRLDALSLGGAVALLATAQNADREVLRRWAWVVLALSFGSMLSIGVVRGNFQPEDPVVTGVGISLLALFFASALLLMVTRANGFGVRGAGHAVLSTFGRYSYGMYVFHQPIATAFIRLTTKGRMPLIAGSQLPAQLVFLGLFAGSTLLVAMVSYHLMEKQFLRLKVLFQ
jgi:peptidoglycan/LPS O-acetylase OafA/YrhL